MTASRALIFGQTGQVATELARRAAGAGWTATTLDRYAADFDRPDTLGERVAASDADIVINAVAYTAVDQAEEDADAAHRVNAEAPARLADACAARDIPLIHISTDYVFSGDKAGAYVETDPTGPASVYGRTKLAGEQAIAGSGCRHAIVRTAWVYSAHGKNFVRTMLRVGADRDALKVVDDQIGCPTFAGDLADGLLAAARVMVDDRDAGGVFHLAGTGSTSWAGLADAVFDHAEPAWGRRPAIIRIPSEDYPVPAPRPRNSVLDSSRFAQAFGYTSPGWQDSLATVMTELGVTPRS